MFYYTIHFFLNRIIQTISPIKDRICCFLHISFINTTERNHVSFAFATDYLSSATYPCPDEFPVSFFTAQFETSTHPSSF